MTRRNSLGTIAASLACAMMAFPQLGLATEPAFTHDVALRPGGLLIGQVVDSQGVPRSDVTVSLRFAEHEIARTTTDAKGYFAIHGVRGGQHQIVAEDGASTCRLWAPNTAPPSAYPAALVICGGQVVRGMPGSTQMQSWVEWIKAHPYITAGTVAAAIAIPIAFIDFDDDSGS